MFILDTKRTAIGKFLGTLSQTNAIELIKPIFQFFLDRYPFLKQQTSEVILGNVLSAGLGQNPARIAVVQSGFSNCVPAFTLNHVCGSGLTSIIEGLKSIKLGDADIVLAGGMENMSNAPYLISKHRKGLPLGNDVLVDSLNHDGLFCSLSNSIMGLTAENIAIKYKISRREQDVYTFNSHKKASNAVVKGYFNNEIIKINIPVKKETIYFKDDEQIRKDTTIDKLSILPTIFKKDGTITAGNASSINDGAALTILISEKIMKQYKVVPIAKILAYDYIGLDPKYMGLGSYYSISNLLKKTSLTLKDIDLFEINEAFASQIIAVMKLLKLKKDKVNISGGAIALGHPLGASGARILTTLVYNMKRTKSRYGIASLCIGGGQGVSVLIENYE